MQVYRRLSSSVEAAENVATAIGQIREARYTKQLSANDSRSYKRQLEDFLVSSRQPETGRFIFKVPFWDPMCTVCFDAFKWFHHIPESSLQRTLALVARGESGVKAQPRAMSPSPIKEQMSSWFHAWLAGNVQTAPADRTLRDDDGNKLHLLALSDGDEDDGGEGGQGGGEDAAEATGNDKHELKRPRWSDVYLEYLAEIEADAALSGAPGTAAYFRKTCVGILRTREPKVHVVRDLGVSGDCVKCMQIDALLQKKTHSEKESALLRKLLHPKLGHRCFVRAYRSFLRNCAHAAVASNDRKLYMEQDAAGQNNTFVPWFCKIREHSKHVNSAKHGMPFKVQMNVVAGFGLCVQYAIPYLKTGTNFNLTCVVTCLSAMAAQGRRIPDDIVVVTDGGDGNWSVATICFWALLVKLKIIKTATIHRLGVGHTHIDADGKISYFSKARWQAWMICVDMGDGPPKKEQINHHTPNSFRDSVAGIFNRKKNLLKHACTLRGTYDFVGWSETVAEPELGGLGYLRKDHVDKNRETHAIQISMSDPGDGPFLKYQTLHDMESSKKETGSFKFDRWKPKGEGIRIFSGGAGVDARDIQLGGYSDKFDHAEFSSALKNNVKKHGGLGGKLTEGEIAQYDTFIEDEVPEDEAALEAILTAGPWKMATCSAALSALAEHASADTGGKKPPASSESEDDGHEDQLTHKDHTAKDRNSKRKEHRKCKEKKDQHRKLQCGDYEVVVPGTLALAIDRDVSKVNGVLAWIVNILPEAEQDPNHEVNYKLRTREGKVRVKWFYPFVPSAESPITTQRDAIERGRWKLWANANKSADDRWVYRWQIKAATTEELRASKGRSDFELIKLISNTKQLYKTSKKACHEAEVFLHEGNSARSANAEEGLAPGSGSGAGSGSGSKSEQSELESQPGSGSRSELELGPRLRSAAAAKHSSSSSGSDHDSSDSNVRIVDLQKLQRGLGHNTRSKTK